MLGCWVWDVGADSEWSVMSWRREKGWGKVSSKPRKCLTGWVHAARSNIGWSSMKSLRVEKQASSWKPPRPHAGRIPAAETPNNAEVLRGNWIAKWLREDDGMKSLPKYFARQLITVFSLQNPCWFLWSDYTIHCIVRMFITVWAAATLFSYAQIEECIIFSLSLCEADTAQTSDAQTGNAIISYL